MEEYTTIAGVDHSQSINQPNSIEEISQVDQAQNAINEALLGIHMHRGGDDDEETDTHEFEQHLYKLLDTLTDLPTDVKSVSLSVDFPKISHHPQTRVEGNVRQLQRLLSITSPDAIETAEDMVHYEFVVPPPHIPAVLRNLSHGSMVREMSGNVINTVELGDDPIHELVIRPQGVRVYGV